MSTLDIVQELLAGRLPTCSFDEGKTWETDFLAIAEMQAEAARQLTALRNRDRAAEALIAKLTEALELAAGRLHWAGTAEPGAASKPGKTLILTWEQEAREALALAKAGRTA